jgi:hypothetical protein
VGRKAGVVLERWAEITGRQPVKVAVEMVGGDSNLLEVASAAHLIGRFAGFLDCRQQEGNEKNDDADDDEEFDEGEGGAVGVSDDMFCTATRKGGRDY